MKKCDFLVKKWNVTLPTLTGEKTRTGYVYLPEEYEKTERAYPVLYMFDGHNVFFDADATYGKSWGMNDYLLREKTKLIVVAIECNHEGSGRLEEYSPFNFSAPGLGSITGKGRLYMDWLVDTLKPYIDETYRTLPDRAHTYICGSSMGGLMSLYAACSYNSVFQRAACLSPSVWTNIEGLLKSISHGQMENDTEIYMDYGSEELKNREITPPALSAVVTMLMTKRVNLTFRIIPGGTHSEASWEKQIPIFMECLHINKE